MDYTVNTVPFLIARGLCFFIAAPSKSHCTADSLDSILALERRIKVNFITIANYSKVIQVSIRKYNLPLDSPAISMRTG